VIDQAQKLRDAFSGVKARNGEQALEKPAAGTCCKTVAITSGKGGVGKTNLCVSLGITLAMMKKRVLILDADLGLANIHILLGISPAKTLEQYLRNECELDNIIVTGPSGVHILPGASGVESMADLEPLRLGILSRELAALERRYDFMLIDTGAGIGRIATEFASSADTAILVVTPEPTSLADAYGMVKALYKRRDVPVAVVVNMATDDADGKETFDRLNALVVRFLVRPLSFLAVIPFDKQVGEAVRRQSAMSVLHPRTVFTARIQQIARQLCGMSIVKKEGFFSRFLKRTA
jgi:flagellar biosynthesis protein FlhG